MDLPNIEQVKARAAEVIGDTSEAWLQTPQRALGGRIPLAVATTPEGIEAVLLNLAPHALRKRFQMVAKKVSGPFPNYRKFRWFMFLL